MSAYDWAALRAAAVRATEGPWVPQVSVAEARGEMYDTTDIKSKGRPYGHTVCCDVDRDEDAAYIAAADPPTILALLAERDELQVLLDEVCYDACGVCRFCAIIGPSHEPAHDDGCRAAGFLPGSDAP